MINGKVEGCLGDVRPDPTTVLGGKPHDSLLSRFVTRVDASPDRLAIVDAARALSYRELDCLSNRVANCLTAHAVGRSDVIALYASRSAAFVWTALGVLKAGAAFCILDPAYPDSRLLDYLRCVEARGWIGIADENSRRARMRTSLSALDLRISLELSAEISAACPGVLQHYGDDPPQVQVDPDDLAYVLFTSGSTGAPKAVACDGAPLAHFLDWYTKMFESTEADRFAMLSGLSHDPVLRDVFAPLWVGGTLCIPSDDEFSSARRLGDWVDAQRVTVLHLTPPMGRLLAQGTALRSLRRVCFGGDVLTENDVRTFRELAPKATCVNFYGATETPQAVSYYVLPGNGPISVVDGDAVPIGRGVEGAQLLVLTPDKDLAGIGEVGEIYVRTPWLSRGYIGDDRLTRAKFLANPFTGDARDSIYRTGDLGSYLPDGNVRFVGRLGDQLKVRGFRIEPHEVELALRRHSGVRDVGVVLRPTSRGPQLTAFVVTVQGAQHSSAELRTFLEKLLPHHMIPARFAFLERLPLTANGKTDRRALEAVELQIPDLRARRPQTETERRLTQIWTEVLGIEGLGTDDSFLDLGGNSLLAAAILSRVSRSFNADITFRDLFEAETISRLAARLDGLSARGHVAVTPTGVVRSTGVAPLSAGQRGIWFLDQLSPGNPAYNLATVLHIQCSSMCVKSLELSLSEIVRRHEALRTRFVIVDGAPVQVVIPPDSVALSVIDLTKVRKGADVIAANVARNEARRSFDLSAGGLVRFTLLRLSESKFDLVVVFHHIIADAQSVQVLVDELRTLYVAIARGEPSPLPLPTIQFVDHVQCSQQASNTAEPTAQLSYWKNSLEEHDDAAARLPIDHPRAPGPVRRGGRVHFRLGLELSEGLRGLAKRHRVTPFVTFVAAYAVLLHRHSGQEEALIGTPVSTRNAPELENLIGFFVNTVVLSTKIERDDSFADILERAGEAVLNVLMRSDVPFEKLVEVLRSDRILDQIPLIRTMLVFDPGQRVSEHEENDFRVSFEEVDNGTAKFELSITIVDGGEEFRGYFEYDSDLFEHLTVHRMAEHFRAVLERAVRNSDGPVKSLQLMSAEELEDLRRHMEGPCHEFDEKTIHELFERQAAATPDAIAVVDREDRVSFCQLNACANRLGHYLNSLGIKPTEVVAVCMGRSARLVATVLGIFKVGAAYLPLDPQDSPLRRIQLMRHAGVTALVTDGEADPQRPLHAQWVDLEHHQAGIGRCPTFDLVSATHPGQLAYVMYTSGSTGRPKGVEGTHIGMVNRFAWMWREFPFREGEICCQKTSLTFVDSVWEIFGPLLKGVRLVIVPEATARDPQGLADFLWRHGVTRLVLVPSLLESMLKCDVPLDEMLAAVRVWVVSGEVLTPELRDTFASRLPGASLLNIYGSTEVSADATFSDCRTSVGSRGPVAIGRPLPNIKIRVMDDYMAMVPIGVVGEIFVGGVGVARGYRNDESLTAQRFIRDPYDSNPCARLFRTGDLGRFRLDGLLDFCGRVDRQVKVRGVRVELDDVEAALAHCAGVSRAVVVKHAGETGGELVAFVVPDGVMPTSTGLRQQMRETLPRVMIPGRIVCVPTLPLLPSAKVDRRTLEQDLASGLIGTMTDLTFSSSPAAGALNWDKTERAVAAIWRSVLKLSAVGLDDNFFDIGGHSLRMPQIRGEVLRVLGVNLPLAEFFHYPTVRTLAWRLSGRHDIAATNEAMDQCRRRRAAIESNRRMRDRRRNGAN